MNTKPTINVTAIMKQPDLIKWAITIVLTAVILLIPEQGLYNYKFKLFLAITVFGLALSAFEIVHLMFISIVMPAAWIAFGVAPASVVMAPWVGMTFLMIIGAFFMSASLEDCGLLRRIAYYMMCKVKANYFSLLLSIMLVGVLLNILTSGFGYMIMAPLAAGLCVSLGGMNKKLGAGLATAVMIGTCTSHAYTFQAPGWGVIKKMAEKYIAPTDITPLSITLHNWPLLLVSILILFIVSKWYKPEEGLGEVSYFQEKLKEMGEITRKEKVNILMLCLVLLYIFTVSFHKLDINYGFALIPWIVFLPGLKGADENTMKKFNYPIIFFIAACMSIGTVASSLGVGAALLELSKNLFSGNNGPIGIMGTVFGVVSGLNILMTPMAIWSLITEPLCMIAEQLGLSPIPFAYAVSACTEAIIFPYEYVPYLVVFGFGMMSMKDFIKINIFRSVVFFGGYLLLLIPYWMLIGLF